MSHILRTVLYADAEVQRHRNFFFVYHDIGNLKHGGQIVLQIDRCSAAAGKREGLDVFQPREFAEDTASGRFGHAPALAQLCVGNERAAGAISQVDDRTSLRTGNLMVIVDRVQPKIEQSVHLGAFSKTEQPRCRAHGQEKESGILLARAAIIQHGVIARPVENAVLYKLSAAEQVVFDEVVSLEQIKLPKKLTVCARTEPRPQFPQRADPLTGMHDVTDAVVPLVGRPEVCVAAKHCIMKKTGAPVCTDAPVCDQTLYELPVDAAFGVVYDLLDFKFIIGHRAKSFLNDTIELFLQMTKNRVIIILIKGECGNQIL